MTERNPETDQPETSSPDVDPAETGQEFAEPERTGVEEVDDVLTSLDGLDDSPVEEHPAVFERAHERLRQALDGPPDA
jgi:hypothetical protein